MLQTKERYLNIAQVADRLGYSKRTIYRLIEEGKLDYYCLGVSDSSYRIAESDLQKYIQSRKNYLS